MMGYGKKRSIKSCGMCGKQRLTASDLTLAASVLNTPLFVFDLKDIYSSYMRLITGNSLKILNYLIEKR
jgi:hypothetical protein